MDRHSDNDKRGEGVGKGVGGQQQKRGIEQSGSSVSKRVGSDEYMWGLG